MPKSLMRLEVRMDSSTWDLVEVYQLLSSLGDRQVRWITFILDECHCSSVAVTPAKYESDIKQSAENGKNNGTWEIVFVIPCSENGEGVPRGINQFASIL